MSQDMLYVQGELHFALEKIAELYRVEVVWLRQAYDQGLLGRGVESGTAVYVVAARMDRIATIVRLHQSLDLDLETIPLFI